jgi:hypothetical protein
VVNAPLSVLIKLLLALRQHIKTCAKSIHQILAITHTILALINVTMVPHQLVTVVQMVQPLLIVATIHKIDVLMEAPQTTTAFAQMVTA